MSKSPPRWCRRCKRARTDTRCRTCRRPFCRKCLRKHRPCPESLGPDDPPDTHVPDKNPVTESITGRADVRWHPADGLRFPFLQQPRFDPNQRRAMEDMLRKHGLTPATESDVKAMAEEKRRLRQERLRLRQERRINAKLREGFRYCGEPEDGELKQLADTWLDMFRTIATAGIYPVVFEGGRRARRPELTSFDRVDSMLSPSFPLMRPKSSERRRRIPISCDCASATIPRPRCRV